ncbi:hypothetical protein PISMIDRAFT_314675 [Pisolithus microcarpus 441]|uniref:Uncharacterized protein n=1 Tax=Pisolithus microcarpus 441 TaxID=765257 RepID=A0A0C9ZUQ8_9AGAM|nr:hypothetical protein PISMIDRAFT_314675 [Pisolithus microcarpus 441]
MQQEKPLIKTEAVSEQPGKPMAYVPRHLRQEMISAAQQNKETVQGTFKQPVKEVVDTRPNVQQAAGPQTPVQTPSEQTLVQGTRGQSGQRPPDRRVSFADPPDDNEPPVPIPNTQNNYGLDSDDDAFLATVDLGDCDLGRPIDFEEGLGGVSTTNDSVIDQGQVFAEKSPVVSHARARGRSMDGPSVSSDTTPQHRRAAIVPDGGTAGRSNETGSYSGSAPSPAANAASSPTGLATLSRQIQPQGQQQPNPQGGPPTIGVKRNVDSVQ